MGETQSEHMSSLGPIGECFRGLCAQQHEPSEHMSHMS